ncbi:MAG: SixA phosphatase family protein, partial [Alphaproteobacteria bacterium]
MLTLSLLRHAKSSWDEPGLSDHERPLAKRGQKAAPKVGAALAGMGVQPDLVLCSSAARTRETLSLVLQKFPAPPPQVVYEESIYMATPAALLMRIRSVEAEHCDR